MIDRRRLVLGSASTLLLSLAPWQIARGARMVDVRMWPAEEYTRVTLEYDSPLNFKYFFVRSSKPLRLVVDIKGLELTVALQKQIAAVKPDDPYIAAMRIGQFQPDTVRLVMDLKTDVKPEVFQLQPFANYKYRLVFDIYPAHPTDEISRLLNGLEEGSEAPDGDPLGSLLAGLDKGAAESPVKPPLEEPEPKEPVRPSRPSKPKKPSKSIKPKLIIVGDPGHGGEDPGAIGRGRNREKTVVLQIAKRLAALINDDPGMKAIMTRNTDHFASLGGRVASARGSSGFCLSERGATSAAARWLAKNQNASDLIGGVNIASVDRQVASVLVDMTSSWTISYSLGLGASVLNEMKSVNRLHKKHVEQAGFAVLKGQGIPSILVETAFISNPTEEKLLINGRHQQKIAQAIYDGIRKQVAANPSLLTD